MHDKQKAEQLLLDLAGAKAALAAEEEKALKGIEAVKARFDKPLASLRDRADKLETGLVKLMKKNKKTWFAETDQITLENGFLLHGLEKKLKLPRNALERIEEQGWLEAVKTAKSVDREVVDTWPLERLILIGGDRKEKETFSYELKENR